MDAGIAAVLGALAGSVATIGAALATGWAQREGARIVARSEHRRERREPRHEAYRDLIEAATALTDATAQYNFFDAEMPSDLHLQDADIAGFLEKRVLVKKAAISVALVGPQGVSETAMKVAELSNELFTYVTALTGLNNAEEPADDRTWNYATKKATRLHKEYAATVNQFVSRAQAALDDDGTRK
jgi:hypothetical protein